MKRQPVESSNLKSIGYYPATKTLEVEFQNGSVHAYQDVPAKRHAALMKSKSVGAHFHTHIRGGSFKSSKVD